MRSAFTAQNTAPVPVVPFRRRAHCGGLRRSARRAQTPADTTRASAASLSAALCARLSQFVSLTEGEIALLDQLQQRRYVVPRNQDVVVQGRQYKSLFVLNAGVAIRYKVLHDGGRQIVNFVLPGELIGLGACFFESALYSGATLTDAIVAPITFAEIDRLFHRSPRLAAALLCQCAHEAAMYAEHVVDIGRRSAYERVAHLLLELLCRLRVIGDADAQSFELPLTQELIADALGLSIVHVNRTFRRLRESGLVEANDHRFAIKDLDALAKLADFDSSYLARCRIPALPLAD